MDLFSYYPIWLAKRPGSIILNFTLYYIGFVLNKEFSLILASFRRTSWWQACRCEEKRYCTFTGKYTFPVPVASPGSEIPQSKGCAEMWVFHAVKAKQTSPWSVSHPANSSPSAK